MNQEIKDVLYKIAITAVNIIFTMPAMAIYDVFFAPVVWVIHWCFGSQNEQESKPSQETEPLPPPNTPTNKDKSIESAKFVYRSHLQSPKSSVSALHYEKTLVDKNKFFHFKLDTIDKVGDNKQDGQNMPGL